MSRSGRITLAFADGHYDFFLPIRMLDELDEKLGVGPGVLYVRLCNGTFRSQDIRQVHRCGLIGADMQASKALTMIERYVDPPVPLFDSLPRAIKIMEAALYAPEEDGKKKPGGRSRKGQEAPTIPTAASILASSMATVS